MKKILSISILFISIFSCNSSEEKLSTTWSDAGASMILPPAEMDELSGNASDVLYKANYTAPNTVQSNIPIIDKKKIIKDGSISVKVADLEKAKKSVNDLVKSMNAYYENESYNNNESTFSYDLKIRIPSQNFEKILSLVENGVGEITSKNIEVRDVTEEFMDIQSRLINKKNYLKKYNDLLSKAKSIKDILDIEEKIRVLQEEIESSEGRLKFLSDQVSYSTLNVNLFKTKDFIYKPEAKDSFFERLKSSLGNGWNGIVDFVLLIFKNWPIVIITVGVIFSIRRYYKNKKKKE